MTLTKEDESPEKAWYVYLIRNKLDQLYCGATSDVERRFREHQDGGLRAARALRGKGPLELLWYKKLADKSTALRWEYQIKQLDRRQKNRLVEGNTRLLTKLEQRTSAVNEDVSLK